jgi:hypothetical protein
MSPVSDRGCNKVCCWQKPGVERAPKQTLFGGVGSLHNMWGCDSCGSVVYLVRPDAARDMRRDFRCRMGAVVPRQIVSRDRRVLYVCRTPTPPADYFEDRHEAMRSDGEVCMRRKN